MKNLLLATTALTVLSVSALAADLPVRGSAATLLSASTVYSWSGFYVGAQIGGAAFGGELSEWDGSDNVTSWNSVLAGVHVGYDHQFGNIVMGVEGDVNARFGSAEGYIEANSIPYGWRSATKWDGSLRARLGFLLSDSALLYATGGVAFGNMKFDNPVNPTSAEWTDANLYGGTRVGWTAGVGIQYALSANWSLRGEYRYADYGKETVRYGSASFTSTRIDEHRVSGGLSYKFGALPSAVVARN